MHSYIIPYHLKMGSASIFEGQKKEGIKAWVFHIDFDKGKDEKYVLSYEMDCIYQIYADKWGFQGNTEEMLTQID